MVEIEDITPRQDVEGYAEVKEELEKIYTKRFNFSAVKIPVGSELVFSRDENIKAKVVSNGNIEIKGEIKVFHERHRTCLDMVMEWQDHCIGCMRGKYWMSAEEDLKAEKMERNNIKYYQKII